MRVFVTGERGFVGSRVTQRLQVLGHEVVPLKADVRDLSCYPTGFVGPVIHLASRISHRAQFSVEEFFEVNVVATQRLLAHFKHNHFVYVSTTDVERNELSGYAKTKLLAETHVVAHSSYCIVRLPSVFGPGQRQSTKLIPRLLRKYVLNEGDVLLNEDSRHYIYVEEAAEKVCLGLTSHGLMRVPGFVIRNAEVERLVKAASRGEALDDLTVEGMNFYRHLLECVRTLRAPSTARNDLDSL